MGHSTERGGRARQAAEDTNELSRHRVDQTGCKPVGTTPSLSFRATLLGSVRSRMWRSSHAREGSTREACEKAKVGKGLSLDPGGGTRERHPGDHGATSEATKGVMPCGERGSPSTISTPT